MYNLGYTYEYEQDPPNYAKAFTWYSQAARLNHPEALNNIGVMYFNGRGVEQNFKKAFDYYQKAAELDNPTAQYNLGCLYRDGKGVAVDKKQAMKWLGKAAEQGMKMPKQIYMS
jgi:TPR repeat protein